MKNKIENKIYVDHLSFQVNLHQTALSAFVGVMFQVRSLTLQLKVCPESERGSGTAAGHMRRGTTPQRGRSSVTTPVSVTAAGSSVTPSQPAPVYLRHPGRAQRLLCSNR